MTLVFENLVKSPVPVSCNCHDEFDSFKIVMFPFRGVSINWAVWVHGGVLGHWHQEEPECPQATVSATDGQSRKGGGEPSIIVSMRVREKMIGLRKENQDMFFVCVCVKRELILSLMYIYIPCLVKIRLKYILT